MQSDNNNNVKKEYIDIPLTVEDTPLHLYQRFTTYKLGTEPIQIAFDFITRLDEAIRGGDSRNELLSLYLNYFQPANTQRFTDRDWPACFEIESQHEDKDFNAKVQTLYNELRLRNHFEKIKNYNQDKFMEVAEEAWETHESILERESKEVQLPAIVSWSILENFLYQLSKYHQTISEWQDKSKVYEEVFNVATAKKLLQGLAAGAGKEEARSRENFSHFAVVALATLEVYEGNYSGALATISRVSLANLAIYSRAIGSLLTLFLTASYAYFMLEQYKESARLSEMFLVFYQKNKKYFSGLAGERVLARQFQKLAGLLCLSYIFLEQRPKSVIMQVFRSTTLKFKDKQHRERIADKYTKLRQNDQSTFIRLFAHCSLPSLQPNPAQQQSVLSRFRALQTITLNTILQHYTQISLSKVARLLNLPEAAVSERIESFNKVSTGSGSWDRSVMQPLLSQTRKVHVQVIDGVIKLDTDETNAHQGFNEWEQYKKQISWLAEKVNSL